jgi:hypothetical protein
VSQGKPKDREDLDPSPSFHLSPHDHMQPSIQPGNPDLFNTAGASQEMAKATVAKDLDLSAVVKS